MSNSESTDYLKHLEPCAKTDATALLKAQESYGNSWKKRGGANTFFMLCRKFDRIEVQVQKHHHDIFAAIEADPRAEGIIDDIRDLRRYLLLVEAEMRARRAKGAISEHRDNDNDGKPQEPPSY